MENITFCQLATSKDKYKPSLCSVYRNTTCMVATDGHRLHMVDNLPKVDKPYYLNGDTEDLQFPDYNQCIPTDNPLHTVSIMLDKEFITQLDCMVKIAKLSSKECKIKLVLEENKLAFEILQQNLTFSVYRTNVYKPEAPYSMNINLSYLIDSFKLHFKSYPNFPITLEFRGEYSPLIINFTGNAKALVMPLRPYSN